ncbi:hypothetical protein CDA63_09170 [Hymenobacter amundsenii]|uniref:Macroglobulin domain-containing protein n=1 Tax=Hymenobacter amundsenii TaxID=2006685 RepID=A0A246FKT4_9BACT|nr:hypothetical protein [Hymenobacter amundsenii]OWP63367.1 hypothetical protein CDA63_09170 [Hymenobacter amundsenii]
MHGRSRLILLFLLLLAGFSASAQLLLDVARFRNEDVAIEGGIVEVYVTASTQRLTYQRRGPKMFQAGAVVTLEAIRPDGTAAYQETITLRPPVLRDTTAAIKNPISFQKRLNLPDGQYVLRGQLRDQYRAASTLIVEKPLVVANQTKQVAASDVVVLSRPASRSAIEGNNFMRQGLSLTRTPGGLYARGQDKLFFYAELYNATVGQPLTVTYRLTPTTSKSNAASGKGLVQGAEGRPTVLTGELDVSKVPAGDYQLTVEVRDVKNRLLISQTAAVRRDPANYAPAGAVMPR